ncbi:MAG: hypothetical protein H0V56_10375, partial [Chthoniobacterales bacterium]|nr:hypothetical protein [Chthoniobacterales bacterium]
MKKPSTSPKTAAATAVVQEHEQLYLVRKPVNGTSTANGFRHHRPKDNRADAATDPLDPEKALTEFADNKRG